MSTVYILVPNTDKMEKWIEDNINYESYQMFGRGISIEHRYIGNIIEALNQQDFIEDKDFSIVYV